MQGSLNVFADEIWWLVAFILHDHFQNETSDKKYCGRNYLYWLSIVVCTVLMMPTYFMKLGIFRYGVYMVFCVITATCLYESSKRIQMIRSVLFAILSSVLIVFIFKWVKAEYCMINSALCYTTSIYPVLTTCSIIIFICIYRVVMMIYASYVGNRPTMAELVSFLFIMGFSCEFLLVTIEIHKNVQLYTKFETNIFILLLGVVIINIYLLSYVGYVTKNNMLQKRLLVEEKKNDMTYQYYQSLEQNYSDCQKVFHDVNNHLQVLKALYENKENSSAIQYEHTLEAEINRIKPKVYSENKMLNIILFDKEKKAKESNIVMHYKIEDDQIGFMSDYDLATILCNLFDNAITECSRLFSSHREIIFKMRRVNNFLILYMENPMLESYVKEIEKRKFIQHVHGGTGLNNVKRIVHKYKGTYSVKVEGEKFAVSIQFCL